MSKKFKKLISAGLIACFIGCATPALAFQLSPQGTTLERQLSRLGSGFFDRLTQTYALRGLPLFTAAVHEEITQRIYGCEGDAAVCAEPDLGWASSFVMAGVRWNDDPPFRLNRDQAKGLNCKVEETVRYVTQPVCWAGLFLDAKKRAAQGESYTATNGASLLHRSHFGDLQFLHSMASQDDEPAEITKRKIMMWAEFSWRTAMKEYTLETRLRDVPIDGFHDHFARSEWRVQDLFTLGNVALRSRVNEIAFGSLLHMVQDSFAKGHVDRNEALMGQACAGSGQYPKPGLIREFHAYGNQDTGKHGHYDARLAFSQHFSGDQPNIIDVGRTLKGMFESNQTWGMVKPYLDCIYDIENPLTKATAGGGFYK
jgi:hypothetical protein